MGFYTATTPSYVVHRCVSPPARFPFPLSLSASLSLPPYLSNPLSFPKGWSMKIIDDTAAETGGYKTVIAEVNGDKVYSKLKYEAGVHRVQV